MNDDLIRLANQLSAASVNRCLLPGDKTTQPQAKLSNKEIIRLINEASILAFSEDPRERMVAYDIVTHALTLSKKKHPGFIQTVDFILSRLANFPAQRLLRRRFPATFQNNNLIAVPLVMESWIRERDNTVPGFAHPLTDFQLDFFSAIEARPFVSISAPTSAGKSFVLGQHIIRHLRQIPASCVIYIVPTRALIREVMLRLRKELREAGLSSVAQRCVPSLATPEETPNGLVYVLTQERLLSLLHNSKGQFRMTMLVVDEAQGIRDGSRGVLLQTGVEQAIHKSPSASVVFASPLISNPEYFLEAFATKNGYSTLERHSPVGQNFIIVEPSKRNASHLEFFLLKRGMRVPLSVRDVKANFGKSGMLKQRALLASLITSETDSCLVYANGTYEAEELARQLLSLLPEATLSNEVTDFITYIEEHIHPEYPMITALKKGVAFHHGDMPASVRGGVEDLFRLKKLQFICCTSTLLQGVNLPAKHLVIDRPQKGNNIPLAPADFLNLAGRAGRLGREFNGNVWCLNASKWRNPPQDQTDLPRVEASFQKTLHEHPERLSLVLENYEKRSDPDGVVTASLGRLLTEYVFSGRMPDLPSGDEKQAQLLKAIDALRGLNLQLPHEVFIRNSTLLPTTLERLYILLFAKENIDEWIPPHPKSEEFYPTLIRILELLQTEVEGRKGFSFKFDANLAFKWIRQMTLRQIIESSLSYYKNKQVEKDPQEVIRKTIQAVEKRLRFELVKGLRAYQTILAEVLKAKGRVSDAESLLPLYLYVECGGYKHSLLSAMSLGFSRTSSLILLELLPLHDDATPEQLRERILRCDLNVAKVPEMVQREIHQLLGKGTKSLRLKQEVKNGPSSTN